MHTHITDSIFDGIYQKFVVLDGMFSIKNLLPFCSLFYMLKGVFCRDISVESGCEIAENYGNTRSKLPRSWRKLRSKIYQNLSLQNILDENH